MALRFASIVVVSSSFAVLGCHNTPTPSKTREPPDMKSSQVERTESERSERRERAIELMMRFAERTGLTSDRTQDRYLWTDAFAVRTFLGLARATGEKRYTELALRLVDRVHHTLGRYRPDDRRKGWLSGLGEKEGEEHPTRHGLRIGKPFPERAPGEPFDEAREWDRDGQYFHYLTQWMNALDCVTVATGEPKCAVWAAELADAAFRAFTYLPAAGARRSMYWKMSTDLSRPLVPSMGQHDPLDGYVTDLELQATLAPLPKSIGAPDLPREAAELASMFEGRDLATSDPLGIGGLLVGAVRVEALMRGGAISENELLETLLGAALAGLRNYEREEETHLPAERRLAFRELGLTIGLHGAALIKRSSERDPSGFRGSSKARSDLDALMRYVPLRDSIESFWLSPEHREVGAWEEHQNINDVTLAASLAPAGVLGSADGE
jgi:hypothetical protein